MRLLVVIAHFFRPDAAGRHSSTRASMLQRRRAALEQALVAWRGHLQESVTCDLATLRSKPAPGATTRLDIAAVVRGDDHLLTPDLQKLHGVRKIEVQLDNPRELPFIAHKVMAEWSRDYDWFVYAEDDLVVRDALLLHKLQTFQQRFGPRRVLQPNRYELNPRGLRRKTYIDGDLRDDLAERLFAFVEEKEPLLSLPEGFGVTFERARNPHSGFFALSQEQLAHWMRQSHFLDCDMSFISPLESAATLGLAKTFAVFKSRAPLQGWLEIEHYDDSFSTLPLPLANSPGK